MEIRGWEVEGEGLGEGGRGMEGEGKGVVGEGVLVGRRDREGERVVREEVCGKEAERVGMVREEGEGVGLEGEGFDDGCGSVKDVREIV